MLCDSILLSLMRVVMKFAFDYNIATLFYDRVSTKWGRRDGRGITLYI